MVRNHPPTLRELVVNHENRLDQLEHEVGQLQNRMPAGKLRGAFWWGLSTFWLVVPIAGGIAALFGEDPFRTTVVAIAFGLIIGRSTSEFFMTIARRPRPHRSLMAGDDQ